MKKISKEERLWRLACVLCYVAFYYVAFINSDTKGNPWWGVILYTGVMFVTLFLSYKAYTNNIKNHQENAILEITRKFNFLGRNIAVPFFSVLVLFFLGGMFFGMPLVFGILCLAFSVAVLFSEIVFRNKIFVNEKQIIHSEWLVGFVTINRDEVMKIELEDDDYIMIYIGKFKKKKFKKNRYSTQDWYELMEELKPDIINRYSPQY